MSITRIICTLLILLMATFSLASSRINSTSSQGVEINVTRLTDNRLSIEYHVPQDQLDAWSDIDTPVAVTRWVALPMDGSVELITLGSESAQIGEPVILDNVKFVPIQFQPTTNRETIELSLSHNNAPLQSLGYAARQMWNDFLLNGQHPRRDPRRDPNEGSASYLYVVPDDQRVSEVMDPIYNLRKMQGYTVREVIVFGNDGNGIRDEIQARNNAGTPVEYVCLVGDAGGEFSVPALLGGSSDYPYGQLNGNDPYPEAAVGRLSYESIDQLERIVAKIMSYEQEPDFEDDAWLRRGSVSAGNQISGRSTILVSQWVRDLMLDRGFASVDTFWWNMGGTVADHMRRSFERDVSFVNYRGWTGMENWSPMDAARLRNDKLPIALLLACNTGDYSNGDFSFSEALLRADGGAIGAIGNSGAAGRVNYNNALMAGFYNGVFNGSPARLGWMVNRAKLELLSVYGAYAEHMAANHCYWANLMGDPGTVIWTQVPVSAEIQAPDAVAIMDGEVVVRVADIADDSPIAGVRVGFYSPNEMAEFSTGAYTDDDGMAILSFNPREVFSGNASITISGTQVIPQTAEVLLIAPENHLDYANSYEIVDAEFVNDPYVGNDDGIPNPNEIVGLVVNMMNYGEELVPAGVSFTLSTEVDFCTILRNRTVRNIPINSMAEFNEEFLVQLEPNFPDNEAVPFRVTALSENQQNEWIIDFEVTNGVAPRYEVTGIITEDEIVAGNRVRFDIMLANTGRIDVDTTEVILESLSEWAFVDQDANRAVYDTIAVGGVAFLDTAFFAINISGFAPDGAELPFRLTCISQNNPPYEGIAEFTLTLPEDEPPPVMITGPDDYGYYAVDNQDGISNISPIFQWVEVNPDLGGPGQVVDILDRGEDDDQSVVVSLPFTFTYYGEEYNELTICSNGWAAFGAQAEYVDFRNLPIGTPQGPKAQLCPWWEDLYQPGINGAICTYYDEIRHRYIVEWSNMRRYVGLGGPGAFETFELILLDPAWYPTYTGDGDVIFQYLRAAAVARVDANGTPYATIGIGNPEDDGGLQYGFWNRFAEGATQVRSSVAIRFSTASEHHYAVARGLVVSDDDNNTPIRGATVRTTAGGWATTNAEGYFNIPSVLSDTPFRVSATAIGHNDAVADGEFNVAEGDSTIEIVLVLTRPDIVVDVDSINTVIDEVDVEEWFVEIQNQGTGNLSYEIHVEPTEEDDGILWDELMAWDVTAVTNDNRILGVAFTDNEFLISGGNNGDDRNNLYRFNGEGDLVNPSFEQPCQGLWGLHDLSWDSDNGRLFGGCEDLIYEMNSEGELIRTFRSPIAPPRGLAVEPNEDVDNSVLWIVNEDSQIQRINRDGNILRSYQHRLTPYGLAWHPSDIDGCPLYIFSADGETNLSVSKMDTASGEIFPVTQLDSDEGDFPGGCSITKQWDTERWIFSTVIQNREGDRVQVYNAGMNLDWLTADPSLGIIEPNGDDELTITIDASQLRSINYRANIVVTHNGLGNHITIPVTIQIPANSVDSDSDTPTAYELTPVYPNPTNGICSFNFKLPSRDKVLLDLFDQAGRRVASIANGEFSAGNHSYSVELDHLSSGVYFVRMHSSSNVLTQKFVLLK